MFPLQIPEQAIDKSQGEIDQRVTLVLLHNSLQLPLGSHAVPTDGVDNTEVHLSADIIRLQLEHFTKPKFHKVRKSILLISEGIAQNSLCGYWEHPDQFVGPALDRRGLRHLAER